MNPVMYILSNPSLEMSAGKLAAQVGHAAVEAYRLSCKRGPDLSDAGLLNMPGITSGRKRWVNEALFEESSIANRWRRGGHYAKVVLDGGENLLAASDYIAARGFRVARIYDEGRTEVDPLTLTAVGVEIVDKDSGHVQDTFSPLKLYRERPQVGAIIETAGLVSKQQLDDIRAAVEDGDLELARHVAREARPQTSPTRWPNWAQRFNRK